MAESQNMNIKKILWWVVLATTATSQFSYGLNLSTSTSTVQYAEETLNPTDVTSGTGANTGILFQNILDTASDDLDLTGSLGLAAGSVGPSEDMYVRFDLENAAFSTSIAATDLTITTLGTSSNLVQGGAQGESFVIFTISPAASNLGNETFSLPLIGVAVLTTEQVSAEFGAYSSKGDAINKRNPLSGAAQSYVNLVDGIIVMSNAYDQQADADAASLTYVSGRETNTAGTKAALGLLTVSSAHNAATNVIYNQQGTTHVIGDSIATTTSIEISGDFSSGTYYLDSSISCPRSETPPTTAATGALTISSDKQLATQTLAVMNTYVVLCHVVDGETAIVPSTYNAMVKYVTAAGASTHADELVLWGSVTRSVPSGDLCLLGTPPPASDSSLPAEANLYTVNPGSNVNQQSFIRIVNPATTATAVEIYAIDDAGQASKKGPIELELAADESRQFTAQDLESGNSSKGLTNNLCDGEGKWRLSFRSETDIEAMGFIRTKDGFLTGLSTTVPRTGNRHFPYFVNPASNTNQESFLRLINTSSAESDISISALDDEGMPASGTVTLTLQANEAEQLTAADLETGNTDKGLTGSLGDGSGKWQLDIFSQLELSVTSMIRTKDGFLTNLSGIAPKNNTDSSMLYFVNPASETDKENFIRIINLEAQEATITVSGIDDNGAAAPGGSVTLTLGANQSKQITVNDLENGNTDKGLTGKLGDGENRWHLDVSADVDIIVMNLIRTTDGFLTNVSQASPIAAQTNKVFFFNPGSNQNQRSSLRLVNNSSTSGTVTISATDDAGNPAPGGDVSLSLPANAGTMITAQDLENGNSALGLSGSLGDGTGKWRLQINSDIDLEVQSLLDTPNGFITNLSVTASE